MGLAMKTEIQNEPSEHFNSFFISQTASISKKAFNIHVKLFYGHLLRFFWSFSSFLWWPPRFLVD